MHPYDDWTLLQEGKFDLAYQASSLGIAQQPDAIFFYMNRGTCLLAMHRFEEALDDFRQASRVSRDSHAGSLRIGVALWWLGRHAEAIDAWRPSREAVYTDSAGGIEAPALLLFAGCRLGDDQLIREAQMWLRRRWRPRLAQHWPGVVAGFLLGKVDETTFLSDQTFLNPILEARRLCRAHFWVAVRHYQDGDRAGYEQYLRLAIHAENDPQQRSILLEEEYWLAKAELEHGYSAADPI